MRVNGVPTKTCAAIGPALVEDVDAITGGLPLLLFQSALYYL